VFYFTSYFFQGANDIEKLNENGTLRKIFQHFQVWTADFCTHCFISKWMTARASKSYRSYSHWRRDGGAGGAGRTGRHLLGAANGRKYVFKNSRENSDCIISYVFACNKNKALQLQRVPILSILGYNIDKHLNRLSIFQNLRRKGGKFDHRPERPKILLHHCL